MRFTECLNCAQLEREVRTDGGLEEFEQRLRRSELQERLLSTLMIVAVGVGFVVVEGFDPYFAAVLLVCLALILPPAGRYRVSADGEMVFERGGRR